MTKRVNKRSSITDTQKIRILIQAFETTVLAHACRVCFTNIQFLLILYLLNNQQHLNTANARLQLQIQQLPDLYGFILLSAQLLPNSTAQ